MALRKEFYYLYFPRRRDRPHHTGAHEEAPVWVRSEKKRKIQIRDLSGFHGKTRQERLNSLGLADLNNSSKPWGIEALPSCQVPDPGLI